MEVFNKFYSSVTNTVSQLSGVLPGNPVTREFEATQFVASAGAGLQWKIYKGFKKSTKQSASIFVFEKKVLDRCTKPDRDVILETLKSGITQLTKLRHPQILTVQHSLEESRESLAFATEPVFASLANVLGNTENMPQPAPTHLLNYKLFELEIKYGLMQVAEGLAFLHNDVKLLHHNINPESIIINEQGAWKIFGFDFCILNQNGSEPFWPFAEYCQAMHPLTQPSLDFLAPECVVSACNSTPSDMYSLGMLIYCLYSHDHHPMGNIGNDYLKYKRFANELRHLPSSRLLCVSEGLREYVKLMLNTTPELRPDPHQFLKIPYFEDVGVKTLNYLDSLFQWDNLQKSQFYKGLPQILQKMPHRICIYRVLPCLAKELVNPPMVPFVLPNVLLIAENSSKDEYVKHLLPVLKPVMLIQDPIQILLIFMQKMELLLKLTPAEEIKTDILPMLYRALESDAQQIQELCLSVLPTFASLIDYPAMKNSLLPKIKKLCINTNYISVRVNCLLCLGKLLEHLDKWLVLDEIIPFLPQIPSREPAVLMGILGIYKLSLNHKKLGITKEVMATKVLPFLMPLCVENGLTINQFNALISLIKEMILKIETEHRLKLEQLNSIQNESKGIEHALTSTESLVSVPPPQTDIDQMFSSLGLEMSTKNDKEIVKVESMINTSTSLSIEDKQRIAQQQETNQRLNRNKKPLQPVSQSKNETLGARDSTSTMLQNNLNQLTSSQRPKQTFQTQPFNNQFASTNYTALNTNQTNSNSGNHNLMSWGNQPSLPSNSTPKNTSLNYGHWSNQKNEWSAFDNLLPNSQSHTNQINAPLLTQNNSATNNIKKLSKSEMIDLLS